MARSSSAVDDRDDGAGARHREPVAALLRQVPDLAADAAPAAGGLGDVAGEHESTIIMKEEKGRSASERVKSDGGASLSLSLLSLF